MDDEDVVSHLQELGLTAYQSRAYVAAVRLGTARPNELAEAAEIPQARIYDVIDDLADLSLVEIRERTGSVTDWTIEPTGDAVAPGRATLTLTAADGEFSVGGPKETEVDLVARGLELDHAAE